MEPATKKRKIRKSVDEVKEIMSTTPLPRELASEIFLYMGLSLESLLRLNMVHRDIRTLGDTYGPDMECGQCGYSVGALAFDDWDFGSLKEVAKHPWMLHDSLCYLTSTRPWYHHSDAGVDGCVDYLDYLREEKCGDEFELEEAAVDARLAMWADRTPSHCFFQDYLLGTKM
jgi:hypothetical protein